MNIKFLLEIISTEINDITNTLIIKEAWFYELLYYTFYLKTSSKHFFKALKNIFAPCHSVSLGNTKKSLMLSMMQWNDCTILKYEYNTSMAFQTILVRPCVCHFAECSDFCWGLWTQQENTLASYIGMEICTNILEVSVILYWKNKEGKRCHFLIWRKGMERTDQNRPETERLLKVWW